MNIAPVDQLLTGFAPHNFKERTQSVLSKEKRYSMGTLCRLALLISDTIAIFGVLVLAYYVRFDLLPYVLPAEHVPENERRSLTSYIPSIVLGGVLFLFLLLANGAYNARTLLRFLHFFPLLLKSLLIWTVAILGISRVLGFDEYLSRIYVVVSALLLLVSVSASRRLVQRLTKSMGINSAIRQRILFVDWTEKSAAIAKAALSAPSHPYEVVGCAPNIANRFTNHPPPDVPALGSYQEVRALCEKGLIDSVILADGRHTKDDVLALARDCEKSHVDFMVIPSGFQILLSCLDLTTINGVPLLGVTKLPLHNPVNWAIKRGIDIVGATIGLLLSAPIILIFALLVYLESPGPVFYRQVRVGRRGRKFTIIKIRSMKLDAETESGARWAKKDDSRRLRVGTFMRRTNIDELPQFWNVLTGDLSLVGPRPERPELIRLFREEILYYNARHNIVPGMTGWAQINGFRGDTDLSERIRCDIYYIENWSLILDLQIMFMTFFRWEGAH
ncbi:MAG TPA: exopolysaccharide biosynthesis polyprenyl glycosylphosphotransferase [Terrimicrobiaceae bacterium]